ncbi:lipopolysaccharide biosynthesis protein, partial [Frankia tisae]
MGVDRRLRLPALGRVASISASLIATQAVTSLLGFVYWTLATREFSIGAVGLAGAAVSLMMLLGTLGMLGLGTLLIAELPSVGPAHRQLLLRTTLAITAAASTLLALVVAGGVHLIPAHNLRPISSSPWTTLGFVAGVALTGVTLVLDQAVLALGNGRLQLERNVVASTVKIGALLALAHTGHGGGMAIFLSWTIGNVASLPLIAWRGARDAGRTRGPAIDLTLLRGLGRRAASHHVLNLVLMAPMQLLSVIVTITISAEHNGYFSIVQQVSGFVFVLPYSITIALFAAAAGDQETVIRRMRMTIPIGLAASLAADAVLLPAGGLVLAVFGHSYATAGVTTLRIVVLAGLPFVIKDHYVALRRVQGRTGRAAIICSVGAVVELAAAATGAQLGGTAGLSAAWVGALLIEAALLVRPLWAAHKALPPLS